MCHVNAPATRVPQYVVDLELGIIEQLGTIATVLLAPLAQVLAMHQCKERHLGGWAERAPVVGHRETTWRVGDILLQVRPEEGLSKNNKMSRQPIESLQTILCPVGLIHPALRGQSDRTLSHYKFRGSSRIKNSSDPPLNRFL